MPTFKVKKDAEGKPVWKDEKPVYVNEETGEDLAVDVNKLFGDNANLRHEAEDHRTKAQEAERKLDAFKGIEPEKVKADKAELERLRKQKPGEPRDLTDEEIDAKVKERYEVSISQKDAEIELLRGEKTTLEAEKEAAVTKANGLKLDTDFNTALDSIEGFNPACRDDARRLLREEFVVEKDLVLKRDPSGKIVMGTDPSKPMTPAERLSTLVRNEKKVWLTPAKGTPDVVDGQGERDWSKTTTSETFGAALSEPKPVGAAT